MYLKFNKGLSLDGFRGTNLVDFPVYKYYLEIQTSLTHYFR